ncbi:MAG: helix-turn-helix domain-containing protein [Clostridiales bacterium]|nr:helix-turn-helix domain-containing protein [Clostridiales bacterium]
MSVDFRYRLQVLLDEHDMRAVDLANAINAPKSRISQWMHNKTTPNHESIHAIAQCFNVSEGWLMGYDVPKYIDREKLEKKLEACEIVERCYGSGAKEAVRKLLLLNADGQQRVHEYIDLLLQSGQYDKKYEKREIS